MRVLSKLCVRDESEKESAESLPRLRDPETDAVVPLSQLPEAIAFASFEVDSSTLRIKHGLIRRSSESEA